LKNKQKHIDHPLLAPAKEEVKKLVTIAELVMTGNELTKDLLVQEKEIDQVL
jgi:hypothetical protein